MKIAFFPLWIHIDEVFYECKPKQIQNQEEDFKLTYEPIILVQDMVVPVSISLMQEDTLDGTHLSN